MKKINVLCTFKENKENRAFLEGKNKEWDLISDLELNLKMHFAFWVIVLWPSAFQRPGMK